MLRSSRLPGAYARGATRVHRAMRRGICFGFPAVLVRLPEIGLDELRELLTDGWRTQAPRALVRSFDADHGTV